CPFSTLKMLMVGHSHSTDASASEGERSADLKDNIISSEVMIYIFILRKH
ncbi:hypothetical protein Tco_0455872, partial [Tanacetum coccineum]